MTINGQISCPPTGNFVAVPGQFLVAADSGLGAHSDFLGRWPGSVTRMRPPLASLGAICATALIAIAAPGCASGEVDGVDADGSELPDRYFRFGETATDVATTRDRIPLAVTVTPPEAFTPAEPAEEPLGTDMFFQVTVENTSEDEADIYSPTILTEACSDEEVAWLLPCDTKGNIIFTDGRWTDYPDELAPGDAMTFRVEYSLASDTYITLELDFDGQAGPAIYFVSDAVSVG